MSSNAQLPISNFQLPKRLHVPGSWKLGAKRIGRALAVCAFAAGLSACRQDMHDAPRYEPLERSAFFTDGRSQRPLVPNTVARGFLREDDHLYRGRVNGELATEFPMPVNATLMLRGQERYNVFCSPCHGRTGAGDGMVVRRGYRAPTSFHDARLRQAPPGYVFDVITNGFGAMPDYASQVPVEDRWAIAAYMKALQLSQDARVDDVPADKRAGLDQARPRSGQSGAQGSQHPEKH